MLSGTASGAKGPADPFLTKCYGQFDYVDSQKVILHYSIGVY